VKIWHVTRLKQVFILASGNLLYQGLFFVFILLTTRLFGVDFVGELSIFLSFGVIFSVLSTLRFELAIMHAIDEDEQNNLFWLSFFSCLVVFSMFLLAYFSMIFFNISLPWHLPWAGLYGCLLGLQNTMFQLAMKKSLTRLVSEIKIIGVLVSVAYVFIAWMFNLHEDTICVALCAGIGISILRALKSINVSISNRIRNKGVVKLLIKKYIDFPLFNLPSGFINIIAGQGPLIIIAFFFGKTSAGYFSIAQKTLNVPVNLIGNAVSLVLYKYASSVDNYGGLKDKLQVITLLLMLAIIPVWFFFYLISEDLYAFVFGEELRTAGVIANVLIVFFYIRLLVVSQSSILLGIKKLKLDLYLNIIIAVFVLLPFLFVALRGGSFESACMHLSFFGSTGYLLFLYYTYKQLNISLEREG
jgi:O-antigen/teichoic acid export membrane protein